MKRNILIAIAALIPVAASAERVSQNVAAGMARDFFKTASAMEPVLAEPSMAPGRGIADSRSEFYIFNNPDGGWAIMAADDVLTPVLAYSTSGSFHEGELAPGLQDWLELVNTTARNARKEGRQASSRVAEQWTSLKSLGSATDTVVLKTANWAQTGPYNQYCPIAPGVDERSAVGCVATAMAIIMRYNEWPQKGNGTIGGYTSGYSGSNFYIPSYSIDNHYYEWSNMPVTDGGAENVKWNDSQKMEVATLMRDCGIAAHMRYNSSSGSHESDALEALTEHFSYPGAYLLTRSVYETDEEWFNVLKNEFDNNRPVFCAGDGSLGGHAFVLDGYDAVGGKVHVNWGWGGILNGFFALDLTIAGEADFSDHHFAIIGLEPSGTSSTADYQPRLASVYGDYGPGLSFTSSSVADGGDVTLYAYYLTLCGSRSFETSLKISLMDKDGAEKDVLSISTPITFIPGNVVGYAFESKFHVTPLFTDYMQLFFKNKDGDWAPVTVDNMLVEDGGYVTCGVTYDPIIIADGEYSAGDKLDLKLTKGDGPYLSVSWTFDGAPCEEKSVTLHSGKNVITASLVMCDYSEVEIKKTITIE